MAGMASEVMLGAVELLPGRLRAALVDAAGRVRARAAARFDPKAGADEVTRLLLDTVAQARGGQALAGVGVASGGIVDSASGTVLTLNDAPALAGYPVGQILNAALDVPVRVEQRALAQVLGDRWFGPGRGLTQFASVSTGETLGVGILYGGRVLAPSGGRSGAHQIVQAGGARCSCGQRGCWKTVATTAWLDAALAARGLPVVPLSRAVELEGSDPAYAEVVREYADNLALGLINIQQLCAPGLFILHGEAAEAGEAFRRRLEERVREASAATHESPVGAAERRWDGRSVRVRCAAVNDDLALLGGAALVLDTAH